VRAYETIRYLLRALSSARLRHVDDRCLLVLM
jgi:hypothetical protein